MSVSLNTLPQFKRGECLIAVIGDEDTCVGMLLSGFGQVASRKNPNFFVVDTSLSFPPPLFPSLTHAHATLMDSH